MCFHHLDVGRWVIRLAVLLVAGAATPATALILMILGDQPWHNSSTPVGADRVANLPGRLGGWVGPPFGGGQYHFSYRCENTDEFNEAVKVFGEIRAPRLELFLHDGPGHDSMLAASSQPGEKREAPTIDWSFMVWAPASFHRLYSNPKIRLAPDSESCHQPVPAPRMDVYIRQGGPIDWSKVSVPIKVKVIDQRAAAAPIKPVDGSVVEANVYDMATGRPVVGAVLTLSRAQAPDWKLQEVARADGDADGRAVLKKVPKSLYMVSVQSPDYATRHCFWLNDALDTYHGLDVELSKAATISGTVTDTEGKPIKGVKVVARDIMGIDGRGYGRYDGRYNPFAITDEAGRFRIDSLPAGYASIQCQSGSYYGPSSELYAVPSENVRLKMAGTGTAK